MWGDFFNVLRICASSLTPVRDNYITLPNLISARLNFILDKIWNPALRELLNFTSPIITLRLNKALDGPLGGSQVVGVFAFYSDDSSSNTAEGFSFIL